MVHGPFGPRAAGPPVLLGECEGRGPGGTEMRYVTPLRSGDSLAIEGLYQGEWDTYVILRRVGTPGAKGSKWRNSVGSGDTCPPPR